MERRVELPQASRVVEIPIFQASRSTIRPVVNTDSLRLREVREELAKIMALDKSV